MASAGLKMIVPPLVEPVSLAEAKLWLRVDLPDDDELIASLIKAARERVEIETGRQLITATYRLSLDKFPTWGVQYLRYYSLEVWPTTAEEIRVPQPPLQSVESIVWKDFDGEERELDLSAVKVSTDSEPGRLKPVYGTVWPWNRNEPASVQITYKAGYGDEPESVPDLLRTAIKMYVSNMYDNREPIVTGTTASEIPRGVSSIIQLFKLGEYV